ncbi:hypothetical protein BGW36DRAFT_301477 [Talaromyces proteolyticus]|uniref:Rhodopsin domain-containing protein n=1 Tax=Talaromyces proteolyticus TaxID=1131652 RepID=A0AAD4PTM9_9EURO|nr:uncharacterized protein BGW36DRAFT_301477 [Talaromyces proteolyticus]KAH8693698.1 hypothetical protein BGW36DRAFT_301477 [Talaromyces proteolyticus]
MPAIIASALEARDAASDARNGTVELWTLYSIGVAVTILRTYARGRTVGLRNLRLDDYLIWVAIIFYTAQTALAYSVGNVAHGLANNSMTAAQRAALSPENPEYNSRVIGSKIQIAGWTTYTALINSIKLSMLAFYVRLMEGLGRRYQIPIYIGWFLVIGSFLASIITIFAACQPFHKNWQINPDPGNVCQPAISKPVIAVTFAANLATDPYLIFIPIPMLWKSSLRLLKKIAATIVLSAGVFVLVCATLKSVFLLVNPDNGAQLADEWGTRETFVAVITTNLPMVFHLLRIWLTKVFGSRFQSSQKTSKSPLDNFRGISGSSYYGNRKGRSPAASNPVTIGMTFTESEERMMDDVRMQNLKTAPAPTSGDPSSSAIVVSNQIDITHETRSSQHSENSEQNTHRAW